MALPLGRSLSLLHHIFLPPKLPDRLEDDAVDIDTALVASVGQALQELSNSIPDELSVEIKKAHCMITRLPQVRDASTGFLKEDELCTVLSDIFTNGGYLALLIAAQNAGVLISKQGGDDSIVETFELSPSHKHVVPTKGRLQRSFPGPAFSIAADTARNVDFQRAMAQVLSQMSCQDPAEVKTRTRRARQDDSTEDTDTKSPALVIELFTNMFMAAGKPVNVCKITKNTRDEVMWAGAHKPWQRSSMWLLLKVALQSFLTRSTGNHDLYKCFVLYYMGSLVRSLPVDQLETDLLHTIVSKIQRRLAKLGDKTLQEQNTWMHSVAGTLKTVTDLISKRWTDIQAADRPPYGEYLAALQDIDFKQDTYVNIPALDQYLKNLHGQSKERSPTSFKLDKWRTWTAFSSSQLPIMEDVYPSDFRHFQLLAFESWVEHYLFNWLKTNRKEPETCPSLFKLMKQYLQISRDVYEDNPEATSLSILTLLDMWMAIDIAAGVQCPLLQEYDHEIPAQVLQELLLPRVEQLRRLVRAESYLQSHTTKASCKASAFRAFGTETSLSVRYFDQSSLHKALKNEIEDSARRERRTKLDELATKTQEYQRLQHLGATTRCDYISQSDSRGGSETVHSPQCKRHAYLAAAENLDIAVHEWPLPEDDLEAKSTVFELHVPVSIGAWRDATLFLIHDVLGSVVSDGEPLETDYSPKVYSGLKQWIRGRGNKNARLGIRSTTKPTVVVHGKSRMLSEKPVQKDVCVANGLSYCYFDTVLGVVSDKAEATDWLTQQCTYSFPERSSSLKIFLERPWSQPHGQPPNEVLAAQHNCPEHMSLESFKALVSLPLGLNVQWMNLLVQLRMPSVDFRQVETCLFVLQMAYQVGPPHGRHTVRQAHMILRDEEFATALLDAVEDNYRRISENWMAYLVLGNLTWVTAKLLSVTIDDDTRVRCMSFLSKARKTAVGWARLLSARASSSTRDAERDQFRGQALDVALVCISAFDADDDTFQQLPAEDVSILLECSILVQEKNPTTIDPKDTIRVLLLSRWRRILYNNGDNLQRAAANSPSPLDTAIAQSWSTHSPGTQWTPLPRPNQQWLTSTASSVLHFNLLTAQLLVDGSPLARLPADYEAHPMYRVLFGETAMEVMPNTKSTSLRFASKTLYNGHMLEFDLAPGDDGSPSDLTVRAHHKETDSVWQLLPLRLLQGHFPTAFVDRHVHWVNLDEGTIEFRPIKKPWTGTGDHWTLSTLSEKGRQFKKQDGPALVNVKSQTASLLHKLLHPLEDNFNIHTIHLRTGGLEIDLPRLGISFTMAPGSDQLGCRQFRDYIVSPDQSIGTLIGFDSRLTVQHKTSSQKLVLIPSHGQIRFQKTGHHVRVNIKHGTADRIQAYEIDPLLGRIVDSGDLPSKLLLCYLHSLTSFALPDPLTKHTGTEQALTILESASVLSFGRLDQHCLSLLEKIASLPPTRQYCPSHHTTTQRVEWNSGVGFLAQHGRLLKAVDRILSEYEAPLVFHLEDVPSFKDTLNRIRQRTDMHLVDRDLIMSSFVRLSGFGAEDSLQREDHVYTGRDVQYDPDRSSRVYSIAFPAMAGPKRYPLGYIPFTTPADLSSTLWKLVSGSSNAEATQGPDASLGDRFIGFDTAWLKNLKVLFLRHWCRLHRELSSGTVSKYTAATWLATLAYNSSADENTLQALQVLWVVLSSATLGLFCSPPIRTTFHLFLGRTPDRVQLQGVVNNCLRRVDSRAGMTLTEQRAVSNEFVDSLMSAWPTALPPTPDDDHRYRQYINTLEAMEGVLPMFRTWHDNVLFGEYLDGLAKGIQQCRVRPVALPERSTEIKHWPKRADGYPYIPLRALFQFSISTSFHSHTTGSDDISPRPVQVPQPTSQNSVEKLFNLLNTLRTQAESQSQLSYVDDLNASLKSLETFNASETRRLSGSEQFKQLSLDDRPSTGDLIRHIKRYSTTCQKRADSLYNSLVSSSGEALPGIRQLPRLSPTVFLTQLQTRRFSKLSPEWRSAIVDYALAIINFNRSSRLLSLCGPGQETDFNRELTNTGHATWNPHDHPEWLLLEVESGITIRNAQQEVAAHMISADAGNAVMQLNMGEGKSSVIVPMVATALAEGNRLVRVVVAKAQSKQMLEMLMAKTAGMIGRRIFHFPFARPVLVDMEGGRQLHRLLKTCQEERGILLVQPEHILSFRLMGLERIMRGDVDVGNIMIATQEYLDGHARDIVDESDAIFSAKFELIYTLGDARPTELSPSRWVIVQELLDMVSSAVIQLKKEAPNAVEVLFDDPSHNWPGRFPRSRLLKQDVHARFVHLVATQLCARGVRGLPVALQSDSIRTALFRYLTKFRITTAEVNAVEDSPFWTDSTKGPLLLLRGLLAGGILIFALAAKRWRINYGPAPAHRSPPTHLVVPYQSKDIPSPRSEFSHPDVVLLLTSLHYYYAGLSDEQLFHSLRTLLKDDQPEDEYAAWVRTARADLTPTFRQLSGVSLDDEWQCTDKLFPYLRHSKGAVDYYLAKIVFPTHMKESPDKISASGWDLAKTMHPTSLNVTTGFSGTNDSRHLLPLPVNTLDLPRQKHTNALVLANLVREENSVHLLPPTNESGAEALLAEVVMMQPPVRVLLDVGAQVLELSNLQAAQRWLQKAAVYSDTAPEAVVFFDDDDVLSVVDHAGRIEPLQASPYAKHLDACLVFLDEAHTRGTDLRLPTNYRAAVTLGADLTKDRLVQACMRMRKLGHGQSVVFCAPGEIQDKIRSLYRKSSISVSDVLAWSMHGTQQELHKYMPLWAMHGRRFAWQDALWKRSATDNGYNMTQKTALEFKEVEALSLEQRYLPRNSTNYVDVKEHAASLADNALLQAIDHHCRTFTTDDTQDGDASFNEEQERELAPEIEEERQRDVPPPAVAQTHAIHHDVIHFVNTGELKQDSAALLPAFEVLQNTSVEEHVTLGLLPSLVMATVDFARTVKAKGSTPMPMDVFQRTPQFILMPATDNRVSQLLLISPYEANKLVPHLQTYHTAVRLHLYAPRINIAYAPLDSLDLYTVGASESFVLAKKLIVTLNLFAGQLYFQSWDEYADFAAFLGLVYRPGEAGVVSSADGFVRAVSGVDRRRDRMSAGLQESPVAFLRVLMAQVRRQSDSIEKTHMGKMLDGILLTDQDFDEVM